tara:strand:- start:608 stop:1081 length:474 start_codon:yes stop_codon:yes gene_type:complete
MATKYTKKHTGKVLDRYKKILAEEIKRQLNKPSSNLSKSIRGIKLRGKDGFGIYMNDYGLNVNQGRSAGKFPPPNKIEDWVRKNSSNLKLEDSKPSTIRKVGFLIGRSISQKGIRPVRFIDIAIDKVEPRMTIDLANAYLKDLSEPLDKATPTAKKG